MSEISPDEPPIATAGADRGRRKAAAHEAHGAQTSAVTSAPAATPIADMVEVQATPPYMEWSRLGRPMLRSNVQRGLSTGKRLRVSLSTDDPEVAKRLMRGPIQQ
jgi:hypothetical protein